MIHMRDKVIRKGKFLIIPIDKPMSEGTDYDFVGVNEEYFKEAKRYSRFLVVWSPKGETIISPKGFKPTKKLKKVYLYEDCPMVEWGVKVPHSEKHNVEWFDYPR